MSTLASQAKEMYNLMLACCLMRPIFQSGAVVQPYPNHMAYKFPENASPHVDVSIMRQVYETDAIYYAIAENGPLALLEIGSWCGASTVLWAEAIARHGGKKTAAASSILCVDPWEPYFVAKDLERGEHYRAMDAAAKSDLAYDAFLHNVSEASKRFGVPIAHRKGFSGDVLPTLPARGFNFIYIDASHYYEAVLRVLAMAARLLADGGLLCGDDLERQIPDVRKDEALAAIATDTVGSDEESYHPGVTLAVAQFFGGRVSAYDGFWIMQSRGGRYSPV